MSKANVEQNQAGRWIVDYDILHRQPQEKLFLGETLNSDESAIAKVGSDNAVKEHPGLEFRDAGRFQVDLEVAFVVEVVGLDDVLGEEPGREAAAFEKVMDVGGGGGEEEEEEDEEEWCMCKGGHGGRRWLWLGGERFKRKVEERSILRGFMA